MARTLLGASLAFILIGCRPGGNGDWVQFGGTPTLSAGTTLFTDKLTGVSFAMPNEWIFNDYSEEASTALFDAMRPYYGAGLSLMSTPAGSGPHLSFYDVTPLAAKSGMAVMFTIDGKSTELSDWNPRDFKEKSVGSYSFQDEAKTGVGTALHYMGTFDYENIFGRHEGKQVHLYFFGHGKQYWIVSFQFPVAIADKYKPRMLPIIQSLRFSEPDFKAAHERNLSLEQKASDKRMKNRAVEESKRQEQYRAEDLKRKQDQAIQDEQNQKLLDQLRDSNSRNQPAQNEPPPFNEGNVPPNGN